MDDEYKEKYLKYKNKYLSLLRRNQSGGNPELEVIKTKKVICFTDIYNFGCAWGDVDDHFFVLYMSKLLGSNLSVVVMDARDTGRYSKNEKFIDEIKLSNASVYNGESDELPEFEHQDVFFIIAPITQKIYNKIKQVTYNNNKLVFMQGSSGQYNATNSEKNSSKKNPFEDNTDAFNNTIITMSTEDTSKKFELTSTPKFRTYDISHGHFYRQFELRKTFGFAQPVAPFVVGLFMTKKEVIDALNLVIQDSPLGNLGNNSKLVEEILINLAPTDIDMKNARKYIEEEEIIITGINRYMDSLFCSLSDIIVKNNYKTYQINNLKVVLREKIIRSFILARLLLGDNVKSLIDTSSKYGIHNMETLPKFTISNDILDKCLTRTPTLYDFILGATVCLNFSKMKNTNITESKQILSDYVTANQAELITQFESIFD